jgi:hypothetical protein
MYLLSWEYRLDRGCARTAKWTTASRHGVDVHHRPGRGRRANYASHWARDTVKSLVREGRAEFMLIYWTLKPKGVVGPVTLRWLLTGTMSRFCPLWDGHKRTILSISVLFEMIGQGSL